MSLPFTLTLIMPRLAQPVQVGPRSTLGSWRRLERKVATVLVSTSSVRTMKLGGRLPLPLPGSCMPPAFRE